MRGRLATGKRALGSVSMSETAAEVEVEEEGSHSGYKADPGPQKMTGVQAALRDELAVDDDVVSRPPKGSNVVVVIVVVKWQERKK